MQDEQMLAKSGVVLSPEFIKAEPAPALNKAVKEAAKKAGAIPFPKGKEE